MSEFCGVALKVELKAFDDLSIAGRTLTWEEEFVDERRLVTTLNVGKPFNKLSNGSDFNWIIDENINVKHDNKTTIQVVSVHRLSDKSELINKLGILLENNDIHVNQSDHVFAVVVYCDGITLKIERFYVEDNQLVSMVETLSRDERCRILEDEFNPIEENWIWLRK
jgi:hypothetical protein